MKIIKRNGSEATFDSEKIVAAITKANNSEEGTRLSPEQIHDIAGDGLVFKEKLSR